MDDRGVLDILRASVNGMVVEVVAVLPRLAAALVVLLLAYFVAGFMQRMVRRLTGKYGSSLALLFSRMAFIFTLLVGLMLAFGFFGYTIGSIFASLGVVGVVVGFAFKNLLENFVAGVFLLLRQPFVEGDRIRFEADEGVVKEINFRSTVVVKEEGSFLYIPNANLFTQTVENLTPYTNRNRKSPIAEGQTTDDRPQMVDRQETSDARPEQSERNGPQTASVEQKR